MDANKQQVDTLQTVPEDMIRNELMAARQAWMNAVFAKILPKKLQRQENNHKVIRRWLSRNKVEIHYAPQSFRQEFWMKGKMISVLDMAPKEKNANTQPETAIPGK